MAEKRHDENKAPTGDEIAAEWELRLFHGLLANKGPVDENKLKAYLPKDYDKEDTVHETISRALDDLRECGLSLHEERLNVAGKRPTRYTVDPSCFVDTDLIDASPKPARFDESGEPHPLDDGKLHPSDIALIRAVCSPLLEDPGYLPWRYHLRRALAKICPFPQVMEVTPLPREDDAERNVNRHVTANLATAIELDRAVRFTYEDADGAKGLHTVEPLGFFNMGIYPYLASYRLDEGHQGPRAYRCDRIAKVELPHGRNPCPEKLLARLSEAIGHDVAVRITYEDADGGKAPHVVIPLGLFNVGGRPHLDAYRLDEGHEGRREYRCDRIAGVVKLPQGYKRHSKKRLAQLSEAIGRDRAVKLTYEDADGEKTIHVVEPLGFFKVGGRPHLDAYRLDEGHEGPRAYRCDRIKDVEELPQGRGAHQEGVNVRLSEAIERRKAVRFTYEDADGGKATHVVDPLGLFGEGGHFHLASYRLDEGHEGPRSYRCDLIEDVEELTRDRGPLRKGVSLRLSEAIGRDRAVRFTYEDADGGKAAHVVDPLGLFGEGGQTHLDAYRLDEGHEGPRAYRCDRIEGVEELPQDCGPHQKKLVELSEAIGRDRGVRFTYEDADGEKGPHTVEPLGFFNVGGHPHLVSYRLDEGHEGPRAYRCDRIEGVEELPRARNPHPDVTVGPDVTVSSFYKLPFQMGEGHTACTFDITSLSTAELIDLLYLENLYSGDEDDPPKDDQTQDEPVQLKDLFAERAKERQRPLTEGERYLIIADLFAPKEPDYPLVDGPLVYENPHYPSAWNTWYANVDDAAVWAVANNMVPLDPPVLVDAWKGMLGLGRTSGPGRTPKTPPEKGRWGIAPVLSILVAASTYLFGELHEPGDERQELCRLVGRFGISWDEAHKALLMCLMPRKSQGKRARLRPLRLTHLEAIALEGALNVTGMPESDPIRRMLRDAFWPTEGTSEPPLASFRSREFYEQYVNVALTCAGDGSLRLASELLDVCSKNKKTSPQTKDSDGNSRLDHILLTDRFKDGKGEAVLNKRMYTFYFDYLGLNDDDCREHVVSHPHLRYDGERWKMVARDLWDGGKPKTFLLERMGYSEPLIEPEDRYAALDNTPADAPLPPAPELAPREVTLEFNDPHLLDLLDWSSVEFDKRRSGGSKAVGTIFYAGGDWLLRRIAAGGGTIKPIRLVKVKRKTETVPDDEVWQAVRDYADRLLKKQGVANAARPPSGPESLGTPPADVPGDVDPA